VGHQGLDMLLCHHGRLPDGLRRQNLRRLHLLLL
jgi:hypothetical protein